MVQVGKNDDDKEARAKLRKTLLMTLEDDDKPQVSATTVKNKQ